MKFKINYSSKDGTTSSTSSSTSSSNVLEENDNKIVMFFQNNQSGELKLQRKTITNSETGELNNRSNLTKREYNYGKLINFGWIYESEIDRFPEFKNRYLLPYKIFISLNIPINNGLMDRLNICKLHNGEIQSPHITFARLEIYNDNNLIKLLQKKDLIRHDLTNFLSGINKSTTLYQILGTKKGNVPLDKTLFDFNDKGILKTFKIPNDKTECYLSRVFYIQGDKDVIGNRDSRGIKGDKDKQEEPEETKDIRFLYNLIHSDLESESFSDYDYYKEQDYQNFIIHLSLAKFNNINDALSALENIYNANLLPGFDDIFTNPHYFNIQIS